MFCKSFEAGKLYHRKIDNIEMVTRDDMFKLDGISDEAPNIHSPISTNKLDDDQSLRDMDAMFELSNTNLNVNYMYHHDVPYNQVKMTPNGIMFHHYESGKVMLYYNRPLKSADHDDKVTA
jgi:hypothetical protein